MLAKFLIKRFVKNHEETKNNEVRERFTMLSGMTGIAANIFLFVIKLIAGIVCSSVSIVADAFNNLSDTASSVVSMLGFRMSAKHADEKHPLGHGRYEYITAFVVDVMIILVGIELFKTSLQKVISPTAVSINGATLVILIISIVVKLWTFFFYRKIGVAINSSAVKATSIDSLSDVLATTVVLISALVGMLSDITLDGWAGMLVALVIFYAGIRSAYEMIEVLLGKSPDPELVEEIYSFSKKYTEVVGIHDLMVHDYGPGRHIFTLHAEVSEDCDLLHAHEVIDVMERDMQSHFKSIVTIHLDPVAVNNKEVDELRSIAQQCAREVDSSFTIHDFRITGSEQNIKLIFDLCIPSNSKYNDDDAAQLVEERIKDKHPEYRCVIRAEHPYV